MAIDMKKRLWTLAVTTAFVVTACTQRATAITIHTIGDSTMSHYDQDVPAQKGMDGWGDFLQDCMKKGDPTLVGHECRSHGG